MEGLAELLLDGAILGNLLPQENVFVLAFSPRNILAAGHWTFLHELAKQTLLLGRDEGVANPISLQLKQKQKFFYTYVPTVTRERAFVSLCLIDQP